MKRLSNIRYFVLAGLLILIAGVLFLFTPLFQTGKGPDPDILASVGFREIRKKQFLKEAERDRGIRSGNLSKQQLLEKMIDREALLVKALEAGLDKDAEVIRSYHNLLIGKLRQRELDPLINNAAITDEEIRSWYEENKASHTKPGKVRLAMIHMKTHEKMSPEKLGDIRERMAEAREKALTLSGERGFGKLAAEYSEDRTTRYKGGDIGWVNEGKPYRWDQAVLDAGFALENIGDISELITAETGLYLVRLLDRRKFAVTPLKKVRNRILHKLLLEKQRQIEKDFLKAKRSGIEIKTYPDALEAVHFSAGRDQGKKELPKLPE